MDATWRRSTSTAINGRGRDNESVTRRFQWAASCDEATTSDVADT
ncbi:hypothetical protein CCACVL1_09055 [Corchorus capsularis]|uniref:Uncharacterized protein n=1 Tax=Corchorus capsularis TaxID=210143 RepID=A0A1R3IXU9_COCAP|nr:hypothetical protein CCACVL1_09055 [Corchorus capsularis]